MISLRHKLWLGFGALLLILLSVSALAVVVLTTHSSALERVFHENYDSALFCDAMKESLDRLNLRAQYMIWQDKPAVPIDADAARRKFQDNLQAQLGNCTLPGEREHTERLSDLWIQFVASTRAFDSSSPSARADVYRSSLLPLYDQMQQTSQWISDANMSNMVSVDGQVKRELIRVRNAMLILVIAGIMAAAAVVGAAGRSVLIPLRSLTNSARQIEAGKLDLNLPVRSGDEIGQLAQAFNSMAARLREFRQIDHERILRAQQTTQLAIDSLPDAVFVIGGQAAIEISNQTAERLFGISPGTTIADLADKLRWLRPLYDSAVGGATQPSLPGYASAIQVFDSGDERFLLPRAEPIFSAEKSVIGVTIILVDVTGLRIADEAKSNVVATVSHELRTPLTSIRMAISLLSGTKFGTISPSQARLLSAAREDADRLNRVIENLMNMSRMESGRAAFQFVAMSPNEIVRQAVDPLRAAFTDKQLSIELNLPTAAPIVSADPLAIGSVLTNLLANALNFTPSGGKVTVAVAVEDPSVAFYVSDTGPGIPPQFAGRIFEKFFRVPRAQGPGGAGLGLAIAKEVVDAHHGTIELCPPNGTGSKFRFTLPLIRD